MRLTRQRAAIVRVLQHAQQALGAGVLHRKASRIEPSVNRVTVYRTLRLLERHGLLPGRNPSAESAADPCAGCPRRGQLHMTCLGCGRVAELSCRSLELIEQEIQSECRFHVAQARVELDGYCAQCRV